MSDPPSYKDDDSLSSGIAKAILWASSAIDMDTTPSPENYRTACRMYAMAIHILESLHQRLTQGVFSDELDKLSSALSQDVAQQVNQKLTKRIEDYRNRMGAVELALDDRGLNRATVRKKRPVIPVRRTTKDGGLASQGNHQSTPSSPSCTRGAGGVTPPVRSASSPLCFASECSLQFSERTIMAQPMPLPPTNPIARPFWMLNILLNTMCTGANITLEIFIPSEIWMQPIELPNLSEKIKCLEAFNQVSGRLKSLPKEVSDSSSLLLREMAVVCQALSAIRNFLASILPFVTPSSKRKEKGANMGKAIDALFSRKYGSTKSAHLHDEVSQFVKAFPTQNPSHPICLSSYVSLLKDTCELGPELEKHIQKVEKESGAGEVLAEYQTFIEQVVLTPVTKDVRELTAGFLRELEANLCE